MKKISYTLTLLTLVSITLTSCKKFLEREPFGKTGKNTLFETVNGAKLAINGSYNVMLNYYKNEFGMYADVASDNLIRGTSSTVMLPQFNFQSIIGDDAFAVGHIWLNIYEAINNVNNVLNAIPELKTKFPDQTKTLDSLTAQGLVMRALCHFDLSRIYAQPYNYTADASHLGIPVLTKTPSPGELVPRKAMKQTYDQILLDLNNALPLLQQYANHTTPSTISYQAALALLSRVYLYQGDWEKSVANATLVINDNRNHLAVAADYKYVFLVGGNKPESIFELTNSGLSASSTNIYTVFSDTTNASYLISAKAKFLFDDDDIRLTNMFLTPKNGNNKGRLITTKYADGRVSALKPPLIQIIRLSELYLNRAEANWNLKKYPEAAEDLRIISQRAHPTKTITINYGSAADLYKQIADERNRELCFEGHRLFDIVRRKEPLIRGSDCNATVCSLTYPNDKFILPIPGKEAEANKAIIQNPGFN
ncbi:RagB/SusD family nutrient uptake outer membrane protein [Pedobacter hiemivivus]|uniref:RagB/SusD family nutrient uptake outer membrane protein n=1 Tax=Pedobacter hiemivivus TaxID=2530454 RepID=A0A4R0NDX7_9SPHI|nr:RagB/SusD family nutrient uptake outer membrane protein [Pedobacter hiemivivus]TCC97907.1 RagB/SusD family nutrient uptake outer membrane protein [Pedobacter hiemivivus]TKC60092.1 RagB/SusD family nutrient uptake outer membrane protein [Pedobacter hiemivivus]